MGLFKKKKGALEDDAEDEKKGGKSKWSKADHQTKEVTGGLGVRRIDTGNENPEIDPKKNKVIEPQKEDSKLSKKDKSGSSKNNNPPENAKVAQTIPEPPKPVILHKPINNIIAGVKIADPKPQQAPQVAQTSAPPKAAQPAQGNPPPNVPPKAPGNLGNLVPKTPGSPPATPGSPPAPPGSPPANIPPKVSPATVPPRPPLPGPQRAGPYIPPKAGENSPPFPLKPALHTESTRPHTKNSVTIKAPPPK